MSTEIHPLKPPAYESNPNLKLFMEDSKLFELRQYNIYPKDVSAYMKLTAEKFHLRTRHSKLLGFWTSEIGALGQVIHLWEYDNLDHRTAVRADLVLDTEWQQKFISEGIPKVSLQDNSIVIPFSWGQISNPSSTGVYELQTYHMSSHIDVWHDSLKRATKTREACLSEFKSKLIGAFYTLFGRNNSVYVLWQHESFDQSVKGKIKLLTEDKDSSLAAFHREVQSSYSKGMLPSVVSPMQ